MAKARVVKQEVPEAGSNLNMLASIQTMLEQMNKRMGLMEQQVNGSNPGNPMFGTQAKQTLHEPKVPVRELQVASVSLECFTDRRVPYIAMLYKDAQGNIVRDFFDGKGRMPASYRTTEWHGKEIVNTKLNANLPIGTILECRDGYGLTWHAVGEKGAVGLDSYEQAIATL